MKRRKFKFTKKRKGKKENSYKNSECKNRQRKEKAPKSGISASCLATAVKYMDIVAKIIANFEKQRTRMTNQNKTGGSKAGKKGLFGPLVARITEAGGGNSSNLSCAGTTGSPGARQLANLTALLGDHCSSAYFVFSLNRTMRDKYQQLLPPL